MSADDKIVRSQQEQEIRQLRESLEARQREVNTLRDFRDGIMKLARVGGSMLRQIGKNEMDPDDVATRLQVALEGRAPDAAARKGRKGRRERIPTFPVRASKENDAAIREYEEHLHAQPDDRHALLMLARLYERVGRRTDAIARYRELAERYVVEEKELKAVAVLKHVLTLNPEDIPARRQLADILANKLALPPDAVREYQLLAISCQRAGRTDEYLAALREAFRWDLDENHDLRRVLLRAYTDAGRKEEGEAILRETVARDEAAVLMATHIIDQLGDSTDVPCLRVMSGPDEGTYLQIADLDTEYAIGSGKDCDLALRDDPFVGERHAIMRRISAGVVMVARECHRVTVGDRILGGDGEAVMLRDKDKIRIGATTLVYMDPDADIVAGSIGGVEWDGTTDPPLDPQTHGIAHVSVLMRLFAACDNTERDSLHLGVMEALHEGIGDLTLTQEVRNLIAKLADEYHYSDAHRAMLAGMMERAPAPKR